MAEFTRRKLIAAGGIGFAAAATSGNAQTEEPPNFKAELQQPFRNQTQRLKVTNNGRYVTSLIFSADYPTHFRLKPELYPVLTPAGFPVTDSHQYCFIHHQSVMCGHGRVRSADGAVHDFYRKLNFPEDERADKWHTPERNLYKLGPSGIQRITKSARTEGKSLTVDLTLEWQTRTQNSAEGETIVIEKRRYEISQSGQHTVIDHFSRLIPAKGEAVLEADRHSFCGVRVNDLIDVDEGGTMRDSEGRVNPDGNYWDVEGERKSPRWVDCSGKIGDATVGMTLMGHPKNLRNEYYVRSWGLMEVSAMLSTDVPFSSEQPFEFAARYVAHDGEIKPATADQLYSKFAQQEFLQTD